MRPQMLLMPGLGGDHRIGVHQKPLPVDLIAVDYIPWLEDETLPQYAERFYRYLVESGTINPELPLMLSGMSLGGAMAQEMSRHCNPFAIILLGSFRSWHDIRPVISWFGRTIVPHLPMSFYRASSPLVYAVMRIFSGLPKKDVELGVAMYRALDKRSFSRQFECLSRWEGCEVHTPMLRIHGAGDPLVPLRRTRGVDVIVQDAKHLVAIAKPDVVNCAIKNFIETLLG